MLEDPREARFDLVLFGGTGDLALRKLMPALYYGMRDGGLRGANIVGAARQKLSVEDYRALLTREVPLLNREITKQTISLLQAGEPEDIGELVAFLAAPASAAINGQTLRVDGGMIMGA